MPPKLHVVGGTRDSAVAVVDARSPGVEQTLRPRRQDGRVGDALAVPDRDQLGHRHFAYTSNSKSETPYWVARVTAIIRT